VKRLLKYLGPWRLIPLVGCLLWVICSMIALGDLALQSINDEASPHFPWEDPVQRARNKRIMWGAVREYAGLTALALVATGCTVGVNVRRLRRYRGIGKF
jgi:ABC-type Fe3+ transport system permease subunit